MRHFRALFISCLFVIGFCALSWAEESPAAAQPQPETANPEQNSLDKDISVVPPFSTSDLALPTSLTTSTAVAVGAVALFLILAASWPAFGLRACSILGTCENSNYPNVGTPYNNDAYSYSNPPPYTTTSYQKRSVGYVEPILRLLSSAYLQYGDTTKPTTRRQRRRR